VASLRELEERVVKFGDLKERMGDMRAEVTLAQAIRSGDPDLWQNVSPQSVSLLLYANMTWAHSRGFNAVLAPPEYVERANSLSSWNRVRFADLIRWAIAGLPEAEATVLPNGRDFQVRPRARQLDQVAQGR
jgi:hypothetical protein